MLSCLGELVLFVFSHNS